MTLRRQLVAIAIIAVGMGFGLLVSVYLPKNLALLFPVLAYLAIAALLRFFPLRGGRDPNSGQPPGDGPPS